MRRKNFSVGNVLLEVLIVIIGISIAFWVNNWGEERRERALEQEFLRSLQSELRTDSSAFAQQTNRNTENLNYVTRLIEITRDQDWEHDSIDYYSRQFLNRNNWVINSNTYEMLKSGGKLDLISNFSLRSDISSFYHLRVFQTRYILEIIQDFLDAQLKPYLTRHTNYYASQNFSTDFLRDTEFQNLLAQWQVLVREKLYVYQQTLGEINELMPKLAAHLE